MHQPLQLYHKWNDSFLKKELNNAVKELKRIADYQITNGSGMIINIINVGVACNAAKQAPTDLETAAFALLQYYSIFLIRNSHPWYILLLKNGTTVQFWSLTLLKIKITIISP